MALSDMQRCQIIIRLLKNGAVTDDSNYSNAKLDYASVADVRDLAQDVWDIRHPDGVNGNPSNDQLTDNLLRRLKQFLRDNSIGIAGPRASKAAAETAVAAAKQKADDILGT